MDGANERVSGSQSPLMVELTHYNSLYSNAFDHTDSCVADMNVLLNCFLQCMSTQGVMAITNLRVEK